MKRFLFFLGFLLIVSTGFSQAVTRMVRSVDDAMFIHKALASNTVGHVSYIDHPDLNGNPDAILVVSHRLISGYNNHVTGVWYSSENQRWSVFNEDSSPIQVDTPFNIYIKGTVSSAITHVATSANQGSIPSYTVLDESSINGNPNAFLILTPYFNPHNIFTDHNYGFWYDSSINRWIIFSEDGLDIPTNAAFNVLIQPFETGHTIVFRHEATPASNAVFSNGTVIDHPLLNGKPNASFVFTHYWGAPDYPSSEVIVNHTLHAWYSNYYHKWVIANEASVPMTDNAVFNIVVPSSTTAASVIENKLTNIHVFPNPVKDILTIQAQERITQLNVYNQLGQEIINLRPNKEVLKINFEKFNSGIYTIRILTKNKNKGSYLFTKF